MPIMNALDRAVNACQTQAELARRIAAYTGHPVVPQHVWNWIRRSDGTVPAEYCRAIEDATAGEVTRYELRPDVFGPAPQPEAAR